MEKKVVLAEKPSVGRDLARVLNCKQKGNGYFEGRDYIVTWALGHLVTLADPEEYDNNYKTWRIEDLPLLPYPLKLVVIKQSGKQFKVVKELINRKDVNGIIIATDAGREGELVGRWILEKCRVKKSIKRLWISSVTDKAIKEGFQKLKNGKEYENLFASAVARAEADWLVGINATRALSCKFNAQLSCGRVQTPTLTMLAKREEEIRSFQPQAFYGIIANSKMLKLIWQDSQTKETRTFDRAGCDKLLKALQNEKKAVVSEVKKAYKKSFAPKLYDLTELQRDTNRIFGFSAKETLTYMQRLYENYKVLTYPRTDSRYISNDIAETLSERIKACGIGSYSGLAAKVLRSPLKINKHFVDNSKVSDHHAIIPTEQKVFLSALSDKERKIYDLVVKRFLAVLHPPFEYEQTTITVKLGDEIFIAKGKTTISLGWKEIYQDELEKNKNNGEIEEQTLPKINKGDVLSISKIQQTSGETKPPAFFNEGTLLSAMENPAKYMKGENKELIKTLGDTGGLGTVATRADIIEKLFNTFLIEKKGKEITITSKGKQLLELVPDKLRSPALTAEWEQKLNAIAQGTLKKEAFINEMRIYAKEVVREIKNMQKIFKHDNRTRSKCPECGRYLLEINGKKGKVLVCEDRECGYRKNIARVTNARCPECRKKLELRGEGKGQIFVCQCGYREKLSAFNDRKKKEGSKLSKRDVAKYLKGQKKADEKPINTALADALVKLKLDFE